MRQLTQPRLRKLIHYNPKTGTFTWRLRRSGVRFGARAGCVRVFKRRHGPYLYIQMDGICYRAGRLAFLYMTGEWPPDDIDHQDGNSLNDSWANLRAATRSQNLANARLRLDNTTGFKGVTYRRGSGRYRAQIWIGGERHYLGHFDTAEQAHAAYVTDARKLYGEFARVE